MTKLKNRQVQSAVISLNNFNPSVSFKTKLRLSRNLRKLNVALGDYDHDRLQLCYSHIVDKSKKPDAGQNVPLTADELLKFEPEHEKLLNTEVEVELHPIEIFDGAEGQKPKDPEHAIDISKVPISNQILAHLLDIILFPVE